MIVKCGAYRFFNGNRVGGIQKRRELGKARKLLREMQKKTRRYHSEDCNVTFWSVGVEI